MVALVVAVFLPPVSFASAGEVEAAPESEPVFVDHAQGALSDAVEVVARQLDSFFGTELAYEESTGTYCKLGTMVRLTEGGEWDYALSARVKLILPTARKKFRLELERDPDEDEGEEGAQDESFAEAREENYQAALGYILNETRRWRASANVGVKLTWPMNPFARVSGRRYFFLDDWQLRFEQRFEYSRDEHFESKTNFNADHKFAKDYLYRIYTSAKYGSDDDNFDLVAGNLIAYYLSSRDAITYVADVAWVTRPVAWVDNYGVGVTYRRKLYSDWIFGQLSPRVDWPRDRGFTPVASITLKVDLIVGGNTGINGKNKGPDR